MAAVWDPELWMATYCQGFNRFGIKNPIRYSLSATKIDVLGLMHTKYGYGIFYGLSTVGRFKWNPHVLKGRPFLWCQERDKPLKESVCDHMIGNETHTGVFIEKWDSLFL